MAVVTGLTPTSQEVRGSPAVSQGWNWLRQPCNQPSPPCYSFLSHHPLCPSVCFPFARGNCQPQIPFAVVWGQVTRGQTAPEDDWSTTTIRTSSPWDCLWMQSRRGQIGGGHKKTGTVEAGKQRSRWGEVLVWRSSRREVGRAVFYTAWGKTERGEESSPAYCSADPINNIPIPVICWVLVYPYRHPSLTARKKTFKLHRPPFSFPHNLIFNFWTFCFSTIFRFMFWNRCILFFFLNPSSTFLHRKFILIMV